MRNLLIITQKVDENDDLLGFFVTWIREFAKYFDQVFVVTLGKGKYDLPDNVQVYSLGKELGRSKILQLLKLYKLLFRLVPKSVDIFAHMSPIFAVAAWPVTFIFRRKVILWYLHRSVTMRLKLAEKLCYKIVTASKDSLKLKSSKVIEVGHGIDTERFKSKRMWGSSDQTKILSVGRISPIKNYETLIRSAHILKTKNLDFKVTVVGKPYSAKDRRYFEDLKSLIQQFGLEKYVEFVGFVPYSQILPYYQSNYFNINLTPTGGIDKAVLEGMATGQITVTSNMAFAKYFGDHSKKLLFKYDDSNDLSGKVQNLISLSTNKKEEVSKFLVGVVKKEHNLNNLIEIIAKLHV